VRYEFTGRDLESTHNILLPVTDIKKIFDVKEPKKPIEPVKYDGEVIKEALALHDDEQSWEQIKNILNMAHNIKLTKNTIQGWIDDFNHGILILDDDENLLEKGSSKEPKEKAEVDKVVEIVESEEKKHKYTCKYCGVPLRAFHIVCRDCRPRWLKELFEQIRVLFTETDKIRVKDTVSLLQMDAGTLNKILDEMVAKKWLKCESEGRFKYYSLGSKTVRGDTPEQADKINELKSGNVAIENSGLPEVQRMLKNGVEESSSITENMSSKLPTSIQLITDLLPSLFFASIITIEPQDKILKANFTEQKTLLDLYEILPNQLKSLVKLHIDPEMPVQKISIPLEG